MLRNFFKTRFMLLQDWSERVVTLWFWYAVTAVNLVSAKINVLKFSVSDTSSDLGLT